MVIAGESGKKEEVLSQEEIRLKEDRERTRYWKKWGPYVAERQWATGMLQTHDLLASINADLLHSARGLLVSSSSSFTSPSLC